MNRSAVRHLHYLLTYLPTYLPACLPACLSTYLPIVLPTYQPIFLPTFLPWPTCSSPRASRWCWRWPIWSGSPSQSWGGRGSAPPV